MIREPHEIRRRLIGCIGIPILLLVVIIVVFVSFVRSNPPVVRVQWDGTKIKLRNFTGQPVLVTRLALDLAGWRTVELPKPIYYPSHSGEVFIDPLALKWEDIGQKAVIDPPKPGTRIYLVTTPVEFR